MFRNGNILDALFEAARTGDVTWSPGGETNRKEVLGTYHLMEIIRGNVVRFPCYGLSALGARF